MRQTHDSISSADLSRCYQVALRKHLNHDSRAKPAACRHRAISGRQAMATGLETLDFGPGFTSRRLIALVLPGLLRQNPGRDGPAAGLFLPSHHPDRENPPHRAREANVRLSQMIERLHRPQHGPADSNRSVKQEVARRKSVEESIAQQRATLQPVAGAVAQLQGQCAVVPPASVGRRRKSAERSGRELHDEIAQTLTGINVTAGPLSRPEPTVNTKASGLRSPGANGWSRSRWNIVHRFARELRPMVLDDLGLIPALHSFMKGFTNGRASTFVSRPLRPAGLND